MSKQKSIEDWAHDKWMLIEGGKHEWDKFIFEVIAEHERRKRAKRGGTK